jgi:hypothetical protein
MSETIESTAAQNEAEISAPIYFQYIGVRTLTVIGPRTGRRYRFDTPGALVAVDGRDKQALAGVPTLRQVRAVT